MTGAVTVDELRGRVADLLATHDPESTARLTFLRARFDAGLAWVHFPVGLGELAASPASQQVVDAELAAAGAPDNNPRASPRSSAGWTARSWVRSASRTRRQSCSAGCQQL